MPGLRITFLGTGTSQGVPMIGCDCTVCTSTDPRDCRTRSSILLEADKKTFVVDTGADFRTQALRERIHYLDGVLYTHAHTDHIMGFDDLRTFCRAHCQGPEPMGLPIYAAPDTLTDLQRVFAFAFDGRNRFPGYVVPNPRPVVEPFSIGNTRIVPVDLPHGRFTVTGYVFERDGQKLAAYYSDCNAIPRTARKAAARVEHLIIDGLRHTPHPTHLSIAQALEAGEEMGAGQIWLTHICHDVMHARDEVNLPEHAHFAYDGLQIEV